MKNPEGVAGADATPAQTDKSRLKRHRLLQRFWRSAIGFWRDKKDPHSWMLSGTILLIVLLSLAASIGMNFWNRAIFDGLEQRNASTVLFWSAVYIPLLAISVAFVVAQVYARMTMQWRWRAWLNNHLLDHWLKNGRYYQLNLVSGDHTNPEYRIADDIRVATEAPVDFTIGITTALLSAASFIVILWTVGGSLTLTIAGAVITIPGFLVVAVVIYAMLASGMMVLIGRGFVTASEMKSQAEAEYRYVLMHLRENGESIAVLGGEDEERRAVDRMLTTVLQRWREICVQTMRTTVVSQTSGYAALVIPIILCAPKFLDGSMTLGQVMQAASAFAIVQSAFNWLVDNYPKLADWTASACRVSSLMVSLDALERAERGVGRIERSEKADAALRLGHLSVMLEDGSAVVKDAEVVIARGERVLVAGEPGSGKSTLVRAIAGLWPWGKGHVEVETGSKILLLPQRAYVPTGTLGNAVTYPRPAEDKDVEEIVRTLKLVGLEHLVGRINQDAHWDQKLSNAEKQRRAFARVILHRPNIVVLDEATSALNPASQDRMMELLTSELGATTIVSVADRPELEPFHDRKITLERQHDGARLISDIHLNRGPARRHLISRWLRRSRRAARKSQLQPVGKDS